MDIKDSETLEPRHEETQSPLPEWRAPTLIRIELKRTLLASGIFTDADGFTTGN